MLEELSRTDQTRCEVRERRGGVSLFETEQHAGVHGVRRGAFGLASGRKGGGGGRGFHTAAALRDEKALAAHTGGGGGEGIKKAEAHKKGSRCSGACIFASWRI